MDDPVIDLRSDTITQPTPAMRQAMAEAVVGDDVFGDDPTVHALEQTTAEILGLEAALFVPSGTMANQLAIRCQSQPGDELVLEAESHIAWYEAGGPAALSGVSCRSVTGDRGVFTADELVAALRPPDVHFPPTRLVALENTHNRGGGRIWPLDTLREVCHAARHAGLLSHLDGARLWNAAAATGLPESAYAQGFDTVSVCFSKGLGAPVGSALAGTSETIHRARRFRKQFGGGMRQAGILAAAALHALHHHRQRLTDDHRRAQHLAQGLHPLPGVRVDLPSIETNMVYFHLDHLDARPFAQQLSQHHLLILPTAPHTLRAVTSLAVDDAAIERAISVIRKCLAFPIASPS